MAGAGNREFQRDTCMLPPQEVVGDTERSSTSLARTRAAHHPGTLHESHGSPELALDLRIVLGRTQISLAEAQRLEIGSVLLLDRGVSEPVDVLVNQNLVARGELFILDGRYCVRINEKIHHPTPPSNRGRQDASDSQQV